MPVDRSLTIILVEDNPGDVLLIREALTMAGLSYDLIVQPDGEQALAYIGRIESGELSCPDIVLIDLNIPRKSGDMVLARLRQGSVCAQVPVVIVTSSASPKDRAIVAGDRASVYFRKPSDYDEYMELGGLVRDLTSFNLTDE